MSCSLQIDSLDGDKAFDCFNRCSNEDNVTAELNHAFLQKLHNKGLVFNGDKSIKVGDIGCGSADTIVTRLHNIDFKPGFDIRVTDSHADNVCKKKEDSNCQSTDSFSLAEKTLLKAKNTQVIPIKNYFIKHGDAFHTNPLNLLSRESDAKEKNTFSLVYASHVFCDVCVDGSMHNMLKKFINHIATDVLSPNGIAVFIHFCIKPKTVALLFNKYAHQKLKELKPSQEEYCNYSPDYLFESCCIELGLSSYTSSVTSNIQFGHNLSKYEHIFKDPNRFDELKDNVEAVEDFYKLLFIAQRSPTDLHSDQSEFSLRHLVDDVLGIVKEDGCLHDFITMHIILSKNASEQFKKEIESIVQSLRR